MIQFFFCFLAFVHCLNIGAQELKPNDSLTLLVLKLENPEKKPIEGQFLKIINSSKKVNYELTTDKTGSFEILLPAKEKYTIVLENFTGELGQLELQLPDLHAENDFTYYSTLTLQVSNELNISFKTNSYELVPSSYPYIDQLFEWLTKKQKLNVQIIGHTDNVGTAANNLTLSKNRAAAVSKYLVEKGIDSKRINSKGLGESKPIATNDTDQGRQRNRRTEVVVTN